MIGYRFAGSVGVEAAAAARRVPDSWCTPPGESDGGNIDIDIDIDASFGVGRLELTQMLDT